MKTSVTILLSIILSGCANTSGVATIGENTYAIFRNVEGPWSTTQIKAWATDNANTFCTSKGGRAKITSANQHESSHRLGDFPSLEVRFMCLSTNDSALSQPQSQPQLQPQPQPQPPLQPQAKIQVRKASDSVVDVKQEVRIKENPDKSADIYTDLIKLDELRKRGILSQTEFQAQKKKILERK